MDLSWTVAYLWLAVIGLVVLVGYLIKRVIGVEEFIANMVLAAETRAQDEPPDNRFRTLGD